LKSTSTIAQAIRLVRRELRGGLRGFGVFLTCLFLGVFAISAIGSFTESAKAGLLADASALLGGDLEIRLAHRELPSEGISFLKDQGQLSHVATMRTMVVDINNDRRVLAELKAVDSHYPLYGKITSTPQLKIHDELDGHDELGALVEAPMLSRLEKKIGDKVKVGNAYFRIKGVITIEPDRTVRAFNLGPRFMISLEGLKASGLMQPGSLIYHAYRLKLPNRETVDRLKTEIQARFPEAGWRVRSWREAAPRVTFFLDRMNLNMTLIGLCSLLIGGLGVSSGCSWQFDLYCLLAANSFPGAPWLNRWPCCRGYPALCFETTYRCSSARSHYPRYSLAGFGRSGTIRPADRIDFLFEISRTGQASLTFSAVSRIQRIQQQEPRNGCQSGNHHLGNSPGRTGYLDQQ
jgi:putative ABC transport system permease protein